MATRRKPKAAAPVGRLQDWPSRLHAFIEERRGAPFAWGANDCSIFACDGIRAITGLDPAKGSFRGRYRDEAGAARVLRKHGGVEAIAKAACRAHDWPELATPRLAQRGDVVLLDVDKAGAPADRRGRGVRQALGLCLGAECAFAGPAGLVWHPLAACRRAWAVARPVKGGA